MKKEELLDLITEFKPEDSFIEEAIASDREGAPVKVYAGKRSPMRIVAPIAACLAVFVAAGFLVVNVSRGKLAFGPAASTEIDETSEPEIIEPEETNAFVEKCKDIVTAELTDDLPEDAEWVEVYFDYDFDGEDELMLCPHVHKMKLDGVPGVRVFKDNGADGIIDLGSYHLADDCVAHFYAGYYREETDEVIEVYDAGFPYVDEANKKFYYVGGINDYEANSDIIYEVHVNEETGVLEEVEYLRFYTTYPEEINSTTPYTDAAYRYGERIDMKTLLKEWNAIPNINNVGVGYYGNMPMIKILDILTEKYGLSDEEYDEIMRPYRGETVYEGSGKASFAVGGIEANGDGKIEYYVTVENCDKLRGFYIFEAGNGEIKLIGALDPEGERIDSNDTEVYDLNGELLNDHSRFGKYPIPLYDDGDESFFFYRTYHCDKEAGTEEFKMHKIVVNENGTLGDEVILTLSEETQEEWDHIMSCVYPGFARIR